VNDRAALTGILFVLRTGIRPGRPRKRQRGCMPTRATTSFIAVRHSASGELSPGSRGVVLSQANAWDATGG